MATPKVPGSVTAAAVLLFVYGGLFLGCGICGSASAFMPDPDGGGARMKAMLDKEVPMHQVVQYGSLAATSLLYIGMIVAGFLILRLSNFGRILAYLLILLDLVLVIGTSIYQFVFITPIMERFFDEQMQKAGPGAPQMGGIMSIAMGAGVIIAIIIKCAFLFPVMILLITKSASDAFAGRLPADAPSRDDDDRSSRYGEGYDDDDYSPPSKEPKSPGDTGITDRPT